MMDKDVSSAFDGIRDLIGRGNARLEAKLDLANQQFNQHLQSDAGSFARLEERHTFITQKLSDSEIRNKEESERRLRKYELEQQRKDQFKIARIAGWVLIAATLLGVFGTSLMNQIELRSAREDRAKLQRSVDDIKK
jgi:hypothetical protein